MMSILRELEKLSESGFYLLTYTEPGTNKPIPKGIRAKLYSVETGEFVCYDFLLTHVKSRVHKKFLQSKVNRMPQLALIPKDGLLVTQDELDGTVKGIEASSDSDVEAILTKAVEIQRELDFYALMESTR